MAIISKTPHPLIDALVRLAGGDADTITNMTLRAKAGEIVTLTVERIPKDDDCETLTKILNLCTTNDDSDTGHG